MPTQKNYNNRKQLRMCRFIFFALLVAIFTESAASRGIDFHQCKASENCASDNEDVDFERVDITVPQGARPGSGFTLTGSNGVKVKAEVPEGFNPGMVFQVKVPLKKTP